MSKNRLAKAFSEVSAIRIKPLIDGTNYSTWASNIKMQLTLRGLLNIVLGKEAEPKLDWQDPVPTPPPNITEDATEADRMAYQLRVTAYNEQAKLYNEKTAEFDQDFADYKERVTLASILIKSSLEDEPHQRVLHSEDPVWIWNHLYSAYAQHNTATEIITKAKLMNTKYDGSSNLSQFFDGIVADIQKVRSIDTGLRDRDAVIWMLCVMPDSYSHITGQLINSIKEFLPSTMDQIIAAYLQENTRMKAQEEQAMAAQPQLTQLATPKSKGNLPPCTYCNRNNHLPINCWQAHPEKRPQRFQEPLAEQSGNVQQPAKKRKKLDYVTGAAMCTEVLDDTPPSTLPAFSLDPNVRLPFSKEALFMASTELDMPILDMDNEACYHISDEESYPYASPDIIRGRDYDEEAMKAMGSDMVMALKVDATAIPFFVDSACTRHMCSDSTIMTEMMALSPPVRVKVGGNHILLATHIGKVQLALDIYGHSATPTINDVLYVPKLAVNLLSVAVCVSKGLKVSFFKPQGFKKAVCEVTDREGRVFLTANEQGRQFVVNTDCDVIEKSAAATAGIPYVYEQIECLSSTADDALLETVPQISKAALLHRRLGHPSLAKMRQMGFKASDYGLCEPCIMSKMRQIRDTTPASSTRAKVVNGLIHMDTAGPITPAGLFGGARYFAIMTDDFSRFRKGVTAVAKSEVPFKFKDFNTSETLQGRPILGLRTDHAKEFESKKLTTYCNNVGIVQQYSAERTPAQNGVAERSIGLITPKMKCALFTAGAPPGMWPYAFDYAIDILNLTPTSSLPNNITPFEAKFGTKPQMDHLRIWGCTCHVLNKAQKPKLDALTKLHIFLGFVTQDDAIYRVMDATTLYVRTARDLVFLEHDFSAMAKLRQKLGYTDTQAMTAIAEFETPGKTLPPLLSQEMGQISNSLSSLLPYKWVTLSILLSFSLSQHKC